MTNPLKRFPRVNNAWVELKSQMNHWRARRNRTFDRALSVGDPRNVLVVVVDCLRSDHVSGFGYDRPTTPSLDALTERSATFPTGVAPSSWTFPSVASLLSGRYPHEHGGRFDTDPRNLASEQFPRRPRESVPMLPDLLAADGYDTGMITAIPMAEKTAGDRFQDVSVKYTPATERVDATLDWIDGRDRWLLHLHLGDPHAPLDVAEQHRDRFDVPDGAGLNVLEWEFRESTDDDRFADYRDARIRAYDAAVRSADDAVGRLLAAVDDETVVVVCGDHGEAFWEHPDLERDLNDDPRGYYATDHGHSVFEELLAVPLWIRAPGLEPRGRVDQPVSLVDVVPTLLDLLAAEPVPTLSGQSLAGELPSEDRPLLGEETAYGYNQRAVRLGDRKLIEVPATGQRYAFDLAADPDECEPLSEVPPALLEAYERFGEGVGGGERITVDEETRGRLSELGYLE